MVRGELTRAGALLWDRIMMFGVLRGLEVPSVRDKRSQKGSV